MITTSEKKLILLENISRIMKTYERKDAYLKEIADDKATLELLMGKETAGEPMPDYSNYTDYTEWKDTVQKEVVKAESTIENLEIRMIEVDIISITIQISVSKVGTREIVRIVETALPFLINIRRSREKIDVVRNHELFHYFHLIQRQKIYCMDPQTQKVFSKIVGDYIPAFKSLLGEPARVVLSHEYWEEFMKARQKLIPVDETIEEEFFHLEKLIFQSLKDEVFEEKYEFIYFILTLYLLYLKIIVDIEGKCKK